jgi:hypothetical protein
MRIQALAIARANQLVAQTSMHCFFGFLCHIEEERHSGPMQSTSKDVARLIKLPEQQLHFQPLFG